MRLVHQKGEDGCGIACVAMLAGTNYKKAKSTLPKYWEPEGTTKKQMLRGLHLYGIATREPQPIGNRDYEEFKFDAALLGYLGPEMHWTVWDAEREKLLDPYRPRQGDRLKFRCTSFIRIEAKTSK
jgi:hypothetical protein